MPCGGRRGIITRLPGLPLRPWAPSRNDLPRHDLPKAPDELNFWKLTRLLVHASRANGRNPPVLPPTRSDPRMPHAKRPKTAVSYMGAGQGGTIS